MSELCEADYKNIEKRMYYSLLTDKVKEITNTKEQSFADMYGVTKTGVKNKMKTALVVGVANEDSIAWGIAKELKNAGYDIIMTYQNEKTRKFTEHLAEQVNAIGFYQLDLTNQDELDNMVNSLMDRDVDLDVVVHAIAFAPHTALFGRVTDVQAHDFALTMNVSAYSLIRLVNAVEHLLSIDHASIITVSYLGAVRTVRGYGIMGVAKAALESAARSLASEFGPDNVTVNVISPGPIHTRAASGVPDFDDLYNDVVKASMTGRGVTQRDCGRAAVWLAEAKGITGQTIYIDGGFSAVGLS